MAARKTTATKTAKKAPAKPAHRKRRNSTLLQGDVGEKIVADAMPEQWLVRKVDKDFGIDLHVEVFDWVPDDPTAADTLGEHFFVQVKSQATLKTVKHVVRSRGNVAKYVPDPGEGDAVEFRVVACSLEVGELMTIEAMGNAVPVLLCVAAIDTGDVYYLCLNDYISKVLLPNNPNYAAENQHITVHLPTWNVLDRDDDSIGYLWLLARRPKFYSAFNTFSYQSHEMDYVHDQLLRLTWAMDEDGALPVPDDIITMLEVFLKSNLRLDIWEPNGPAYWSPLGDVQKDFLTLQALLPQFREPHSAERLMAVAMQLIQVFNRAANLGRMYEELCREWRLPTALAVLMDDHPGLKYRPEAVPKVIKKRPARRAPAKTTKAVQAKKTAAANKSGAAPTSKTAAKRASS